MKIKLNGIEIEMEGDAEVIISDDGKHIVIKPQPQISLQPITTPYVWPNITYPNIYPNYPGTYPNTHPYPNTYPWGTTICGSPNDVGSVSSGSYTVRADDPNLQISYTTSQIQ